MDWTTCVPGLTPDPVVGEVGDYTHAAGEARRLRRTTGDVVDEFGRLADAGDLTGLRGATADALVGVMTDVGASLGDLPLLFERLDDVFTRHAERLCELRRQAAAALARARLARRRRDDAGRRLDGERAELRAIDDQLRWLRGADPVVHAERVVDLEQTRWSQVRRVDRARGQVERADDDLAASRAEHDRLAEASRELVDTTVVALTTIELGDLADPTGIIERLVAFGGAVGEAIDGVVVGATDRGLDALGVLLDGLVTVAVAAFDVAVTALAVALGVVLLTGAIVVASVVAAVVVSLAATFLPFAGTAAIAAAIGLVDFPTRPDERDDHGGGDPGGTYTARPVLDWDLAGDAEIGRTVLTTALAHTADGDRIRADEFEIVTIEAAGRGRQHVVVLPGVVDLSNPDLGWDGHHRSVRDIDRAALSSSTGTGIDGNPYAVMVYQAMMLHGAEPGDRVMIVGHSYGADTALDLAADPRFNGPGAFEVTHVHAAAYHSGPQMPHVPPGTELLVTQNANDLVVQGENFGYDVVGSVDSYADATAALLDGDLVGGSGDLARFIGHATGLGHPIRGQFETLVPGVRTIAPGQHRIVFDGGAADAGHHPDHYIEFLDGHASGAATAFEASVAAAGYGGPGVVRSIDVSVPLNGIPTLSTPGG